MAALKAADDAAIEIIRQNPNGISDDALGRELPHMSAQERSATINRLVANKRIQLLEVGPNKAVHYREISAEEVAKFKGLGPEEMLLYQTIRSAGNTGLWTKDMKLRTNMAQPHITKILRTLESRRLVKAVKNVNNPSRKVYMLAELEPSRELTGGAWYSDNQFDNDFIEVLRTAVFAFIDRKGQTTLREIADFIAAKKFAKVDLRDEDVKSIVMTLVYDGRIETVDADDPDDEWEHYRPMHHTAPDTTALTSVPCGICPVIEQCHDDGVISPATCEYYNKWLQF